MDGFKTIERSGITVSPGDRVALATLTIEVGGLEETVTVAGESPLIQSRTGERSFTVATDSVQNLPDQQPQLHEPDLARPWRRRQRQQPGRLGGGGSNNTLMDGVSTVDTGNNQPVLFLNLEAIAEVKVLTSGYQAEYGKASGIQITAVTKSGTNQFRGSLYDVRRDSDWNSNSWANIKNGTAKAVNKEDDWGYSIGGPIGKPGGRNKLFFFFSQEWKPRTTAGALNRFRFPTALERAGDFSQSLDNNGNIFNLIRNASTNLPCTAANTTGCYPGRRRRRAHSAERALSDGVEHPAAIPDAESSTVRRPGLQLRSRRRRRSRRSTTSRRSGSTISRSSRCARSSATPPKCSGAKRSRDRSPDSTTSRHRTRSSRRSPPA